jgi:hypothetical protein
VNPTPTSSVRPTAFSTWVPASSTRLFTSPGVNLIKLFSFVTDAKAKYNKDVLTQRDLVPKSCISSN